MQQKYLGRLRPIYHINQFEAPEEGLDLVVVPGLWIDYPPNQYNRNCSWIKPLVASTPNDTRVFLFTYRLEIDGSSLWNQLLGQSRALREGLDENRKQSGYDQRPLLFIAHSLGGFIVKRVREKLEHALTLTLPSRKSYEETTSGIIFLGCPHLTSTSVQGWDNLMLIMKGNRKDVSKQNMTPEEMDSIATTCRKFDSLQLIVDVLSVYEQKETKIRENLLYGLRPGSKPTTMLASRNLVEIKSMNETLFGVDRNHLCLSEVTVNDPLYNRLVEYFSIFAQHAPANVKIAAGNGQDLNLSHQSLRMRSSVGSLQERADKTLELPVHQVSGSDAETQIAQTTENEPPPDDISKTDVGQHQGVQFPFSHIASASRNEDYFGRKDIIDQIDKAFELDPASSGCLDSADGNAHGSDRSKSFVLSGMGGMGKTAIATEYFFSRRDHFDAVFWIYADTHGKLAAQFGDIATELEQETSTQGLDEDSSRRIVKGWLQAPIGYRMKGGCPDKVENATWLVVFDNADDPDILHKWLPDRGQGCILVTGRYPYSIEKPPGLSKGVELKSLSPSAGGQMLRKFSGREEEADAVDTSQRISKLLGGLPLGICQMSAIIRGKHLALRDFEEWYPEDPERLHNLKMGTITSNYQYTVGTTWAIEQLSPQSRAILKVLSLLDPDRITEELLIDGAKNVQLKDYPVKKFQYFDARAELIQSSLITKNMATNELRIHRLLQDVVRHQMDTKEAETVFAAVMELMLAVWPFVSGTDPTRNQSWRVPIAEQFTPHICRLEELFGSAIRESRHQATAASGYIFCSYAWYISERGLSYQIETFASLARVILLELSKSSNGDQERITHWLGEAYHNLSLAAVLTSSSDGLEDANLWMNLLEDRIKRFNPDSEQLSLATAWNQIGICHQNKGEIDPAIQCWKRSTELFANAKNRPELSGFFPAINLALMSVLQGRPKEGEEGLKPTLEEHERILGPNDKSTTECGHIWRGMGKIRSMQQRYEEAIEFHKRAIENLEATLGETHSFTGDSYYELAVDYMHLGENGPARNSFDSAIKAFTTGSHREAQAARAYWKKGLLLQADGEALEANRLLAEAMRLRSKILPKDARRLEDLVDLDWATPIIYWSR